MGTQNEKNHSAISRLLASDCLYVQYCTERVRSNFKMGRLFTRVPHVQWQQFENVPRPAIRTKYSTYSTFYIPHSTSHIPYLTFHMSSISLSLQHSTVFYAPHISHTLRFASRAPVFHRSASSIPYPTFHYPCNVLQHSIISVFYILHPIFRSACYVRNVLHPPHNLYSTPHIFYSGLHILNSISHIASFMRNFTFHILHLTSHILVLKLLCSTCGNPILGC